MSRAYAIIEVSERTYREIRAAIIEAHYSESIHRSLLDDELIDMHSLALRIRRPDGSANGKNLKPSANDEKSGRD